MILAGCSGGGSSSEAEYVPFVGGTEGISFDFEPGAPPNEIYDMSGGQFPFDIDVRMFNIGESDIASGDLSLRILGINPADFSLPESSTMTLSSTALLQQTDKDSDGNTIYGGELNLGFYELQYQGELTGNIRIPIRSEICYKYTTTTNAKLCYRSDFSEYDREDYVCDPRETKTTYNSGGPVHVNRLEQSVIGENKISFSFTVRNVGSGLVFRKDGQINGEGDGKTCGWNKDSSESIRTFEERIWVKVENIINGAIDCPTLSNIVCDANSCQGEIKLYNNERIVRCTQDINVNTDFEKVVNIYTTYNYEEAKERQLLIKHGI